MPSSRITPRYIPEQFIGIATVNDIKSVSFEALCNACTLTIALIIERNHTADTLVVAPFLNTCLRGLFDGFVHIPHAAADR